MGAATGAHRHRTPLSLRPAGALEPCSGWSGGHHRPRSIHSQEAPLAQVTMETWGVRTCPPVSLGLRAPLCMLWTGRTARGAVPYGQEAGPGRGPSQGQKNVTKSLRWWCVGRAGGVGQGQGRSWGAVFASGGKAQEPGQQGEGRRRVRVWTPPGGMSGQLEPCGHTRNSGRSARPAGRGQPGPSPLSQETRSPPVAAGLAVPVLIPCGWAGLPPCLCPGLRSPSCSPRHHCVRSHPGGHARPRRRSGSARPGFDSLFLLLRTGSAGTPGPGDRCV